MITLIFLAEEMSNALDTDSVDPNFGFKAGQQKFDDLLKIKKSLQIVE